jgi:hypothetical protein
MENTNNDIQNHYRFSEQHQQQQQQQNNQVQQQNLQQLQLEQDQQAQERNQSVHSQHPQSLHTNFDQHDTSSVLDFDPNFYTSHAHLDQFNNLSSSTSSVDLNVSYKQLIDDHVLYTQQLKSNTDLTSAESASIPSNQFHPHDTLLMHQNPSNLIFDNNTASTHENSFIFKQQQQQLLNTDMSVIANSFDHSELPLASSHNFEHVEHQQRQEQDVFCELLSLATNSSNRHTQHQHEADPWQQGRHSDSSHFISSFEDASALTQQQFHEHLLINQQKKENYYSPSSSNPPNSGTVLSPSSSAMVAEESNEPLLTDESGPDNALHSDDR